MKKQGIYLIVLALFLSACTFVEDKAELVAKVGTRVLTMEELKEKVPDYLDQADSTLWAEDYITTWIQRELFLMKAEESLGAELKDVSKELEEYRSSLIVYRYKNELLKQQMDTTVKEEDILNYFNENKKSFILNRNIVKAIYIKVPVEVSSPENIKDLCSSNDPQKLAKLNEYCLSYAKAYDRFNDKWVAADMVLNNTPMVIQDQKSVLEKNRFIESSDMDFYYIVCIRDYKLAGQVSPTEFVHNDIKNLILSKQKTQFLKQIEKEVYQDGLDQKKVKIYKTKK